MVMKTRTLRRRVIIREYDFHKVQTDALESKYGGQALYDRVSFTPLNEDTLEKLRLQELLKGKTGPLTEINFDLTSPTLLVYQLRDYLYDGRYYDWNVSTDLDGFLCVQARKNTPKTRLGWGVFEKDLVCRL
jgi:hypothetical protein